MSDLQVKRLSIRALDVRVPLEVHGDELASAIAVTYRGRLEESSTFKRASALSVAVGPWGMADVTGAEVGEVLTALRVAVNAAASHAVAAEMVVLQAAALAEPDSGATAVVVAASPAEVSALTGVLDTGMTCLDAELIAVTGGGVVVPMTPPPTDRVHRLGGLVTLEQDPRHVGAPEVTLLDTIEGLAVLAPHAPYLSWLPAPLQVLAQVIHRGGAVRRIVYHEPSSLEPVLRQLVEGADR